MNKNMKIMLCVGIAAMLCVGGLAIALSSSDKDDRPTIVCTAFPQYDWVNQILGEKAGNFNVVYLLGKGTDVHSYSPSTKDVATIKGCDLLIYVGGESDEWVEEILDGSNVNENMIVINLVEIALTNNGSGTFAYNDPHLLTWDPPGEDDHETDEHVWLSLTNAIFFVKEIAEAICEINEANSEYYMANATAYGILLSALSTEYKSTFNAGTLLNHNKLLFADRFPFIYLMREYNIRGSQNGHGGLGSENAPFFAAFSGCAATTEVSVATIAGLVGMLDTHSIDFIIVTETGNLSLANTLMNDSSRDGHTILVLYACQSISQEQIDKGASYLMFMALNLATLKTALGV